MVTPDGTPGRSGRDAPAAASGPIRGLPERVQPLRRQDPTRVGPYHLEGLLGNGGMGSVYLGRSADGRRVAVKVIRADLAADPGFQRLFHREALMARRVARFCTAEVLDSGSDDGRPYLVTEFVDGPSLAVEIQDNGPLTSARLERVAIAVATALTAIHDAGTVHRDLKPSNVLLSIDGPLVIDFGIAVALENSTQATRHSPGTPGFMAPEQASGTRVGPPADIFAWGGLVAFAATGIPPFGTGSTPALIYRVVHQPPEIAGVPEPLRTIIAEAMHKDPALRPTAAQLYLRLLGAAPPAAGGPTALLRPPAEPDDQARPAATADPDAAPAATRTPPAVAPGSETAYSAPPPPVVPAAGLPAATASVPAPATASVPPPPWTTPSPRRAAAEDHEPPRAGRPPRTGRERVRRPRAAVLVAAVVVAALLVTVPLLLTSRRAGTGSTAAPTGPATSAASAADERASRTLADASLHAAGSQPALARRLALAAYRLAPTTEARRSVLAAFAGAAGPRATLAGHTNWVWNLAFSPDGSRLATASTDRTARLWDTSATGQTAPLATFGEAWSWMWGVAFSPDGTQLATTSGDGTATLWDTTRRGDVNLPVAILKGHQSEVRELAFSPRGSLLATAGDDGTVRLWDTASRGFDVAPLATLSGHGGKVTAIAFSSDGTLLAAASEDGAARLWDPATRSASPAPLAVLTGHRAAVRDVAFSPDGTIIATSGDDGTARLWDAAIRGQVAPHTTFVGHQGVVARIAFSPDGSLLATSGLDGTARLWDARARGTAVGAVATLTGHQNEVTTIVFSKDGSVLATGSGDATVRLWDPTARGDRVTPLATLTGHSAFVKDVAFGPDGSLLASASDDGTALLYDVSPASLAATACADPANRITADEWAGYLDDVPYAAPCG